MTTDEGSRGRSARPDCDEQVAAFAGQVSHDLKNPLAAIRMCLELAREEIGDREGEVLALIARAERGVARMDGLINDLREYARVDPGRHVDVPLAEVAADLLAELGDGVASTQVQGVADLPTVHGDREQLHVVLRHLVENALQVSPADSVVQLWAERVAGGWRISVADRGTGVPDGQHERIFEPLVRLDKTVPGTGVGLATSRRIVAAHGGRTGVEDRAGGGAVVWFELPD